MTALCNVPWDELQALAVGMTSASKAASLRAHTAECAHCQERLARIEQALSPIRDRARPPLDSNVVRREVMLAVQSSVSPKRAQLPWLRLTLGVMAAGIAVFVLMVRAPVTEAPVVTVVQGALDAELSAQTPVDVVSPTPVVLRLRDVSSITALPQTRFAMQNADASRWQLEVGHLALSVQPRGAQPLYVSTRELTVKVVGTAFTVERQITSGGGITRVAVSEGVVEVEERTGMMHRVAAGEAWSATSGEAVTTIESPTPAPEQPTTQPAVKSPAFNAKVIRSSIEAGEIVRARALIEQSRRDFGASSHVLAELGILGAEADLAERKVRPAMDKYLAVVSDFPDSPQAEQALFAAAQLAMDAPDKGYKPALLLRDYLATYPQGRFRGEAERLLKAVENEAPRGR